LYDSLLYLLALFANILESYDYHIRKDQQQQKTSKSAVLLRTISNEQQESILFQIIALFQPTITISTLHSNTNNNNDHEDNDRDEDVTINWMEYLLIQLISQSNSFLQDLETTDHQFQHDHHNHHHSKNGSVNGDDKANEEEVIATGEGGQLPLAEIILSAHLILLFTTLMNTFLLCTPTTHSTTNSTTSSSQQQVFYTALEKQRLYIQWRNKLPRQSWWLGIRILKAYLALQGQVSYYRLIYLM